MTIGVYSSRPDEREFIEKFSNVYETGIKMIHEDPVLETVEQAAGCDCISIITNTFITAEMLDRYKKLGVRFISTRTVGFEHIDVEHAKQIGIGVGNVTYTPDSVAEFAVMLMLMVLRNTKPIEARRAGQDYALTMVRGRLLSDMTVGIMGTGRIGVRVAEQLAGFGCRILAADSCRNEALSEIVQYVEPEILYRDSDIVTLHMPSNKENFHVIDSRVFEQMKTGAVLINTARGELVDTKALIEALESGKLGGAGLDVIEGDRLIYYRDLKCEIVPHHEMAILNFLPNVVITPHMAFYTDHSVSDMVENSIRSCAEYMKSNKFKF